MKRIRRESWTVFLANEELKKEVLAPITAMYSEKFRLHKMNTRFGVSNISESEFEGIVESFGYDDLVEHHAKFLGRVYQCRKNDLKLVAKPHSKTVDPLKCWNSGVQMVGLNMQYINKEQLLNYGMFRKNGGAKCGNIWLI